MSLIQTKREQIASLEAEIKQIQSECSHPPSVRETRHHDNDPDPLEQLVRYRTYHCGLCDARWTTESLR